MSNKIFSPAPFWQDQGLAIIRILVGFFMIYHGWEIFYSAKMAEYQKWDVIKVLPAPVLMVYLGKAFELISGICFVLGLFTRPAAIFMAITMLFICFKIGNGRFYSEDQHPFLFALLAMVFFFTGPGSFSLDNTFFKK